MGILKTVTDKSVEKLLRVESKDAPSVVSFDKYGRTLIEGKLITPVENFNDSRWKSMGNCRNTPI